MTSAPGGHRHPHTEEGDQVTYGGLGFIPATEDDYFVSGKDGQGHSSQLPLNIHPLHFAAILDIIHAPNSPFKNPGDFGRWAVREALKIYAEMEGWNGNVTALVSAEMTIMREEEYRFGFEDTMMKAQELVARHMADGQPEMAGEMLSKIKEDILALPEGDWKNKILARFADLFGGYHI